MSISNITWQQVAVLALCLGAAFAAHLYLGLAPGMAVGFVTSVVAFFLGRPAPKDGAP